MTRLDLPEVYDADARDRYQIAQDYVRNAGKRRSRWTAVLVVAVVVLVLSLVALGLIGFSYYQGQHKYSQLAQSAGIDRTAAEEQAPLVELTVDWEALYATNPDTVAWLCIPNTKINYPVVRGTDNEYYLTHDFEGDQGWLANFGAIFMDWRNVPDWSDEAYYFYGHHMNDGSMFAGIAEMADQQRFDASRISYVLSPQGSFRLRSFALVHCSADEPIVQVDFAGREEMAAYVQDMMDRSVVAVDQTVAADQITKVFAFSTCDDGSAGRYVLFSYVEAESELKTPDQNRDRVSSLDDLA